MKKLGFILCCLLIPLSMDAAPLLKNGADQLELLLAMVQKKHTALVVNQTSITANGTHLLDTLHRMKVSIRKVFAPEHGFRGKADAGETIRNGKDLRTGIPILSLYGKNKKPLPQWLQDTDVIIFDIQDVGARFYTYISTLYYVMQACAENGKEIIVLDRPNPCDYVDGPVLNMKYKSFVGMLPIPLLHGCTVGEIAQMINGEGWLGNHLSCKLKVITVKGWKHGQPYSLPVKPSPNLPNDLAIALYPSLCPFEGTSVSVGRGTHTPFQVLGSPLLKQSIYNFRFKPEALEGFDKHPLHQGKYCYGHRLDASNVKGFSLHFIQKWYHDYQKEGIADQFFTRPQWFDLLMGTDQVRKGILAGKSATAIESMWQPALQQYRLIREKYLIYPDHTSDKL